MPIPASVLQLIEKFDAHSDEYRAPSYNETELRRDFLDPFFAALGWDVENKRVLSLARRDVSHEFSIKIQGDEAGQLKDRAPDYAFRIGEADEKPVFFVEAKKPSVNVHDSAKYAYQTREYGWNAGLPLCVLTDFEEFAIYDCRSKPEVTQGPEIARVEYFKFAEYETNWEKIEGLFGRDAVKTGALNRRAEIEKKKRKGSETVNAAFLALIGKWREMLARELVRTNPKLDSADLNFAVQMTIDRIIFLRMAEDRDLEPWGTLQNIARGKNIYPALLELFLDADDRYNSGLFHFPNPRRSGKKRPGFEDTLSPTLKIGDNVLSDMIKGVYRPSPFNFRVMPIEILGQVYEQFLGKVITVSDRDPKTGLRIARGASIDDKPEVRKAGGVYYTPAYIVDAIVKQTVGALCAGKTPKQLETLRVLDPASGSGSFLIGAYGYLLAYHLDFYSKTPERWLKGKDAPLFALPDPLEPDNPEKRVYRLTTREKKRILLNNIYGVDIDRQAVEVTKLSLLLRVLEDESSEGLKLLSEPALPDLDNNIKCGNSLIGPDFYDTTPRESLSEAECNRINEFDWASAFPDVMKSGGFDAVIGNPPWVSLTGRFKNEVCSTAEINYLIERFNGNTYMPNMYEYFVSQGLTLTKISGHFGLIVPDRLGYNNQFMALRKRLLEESEVISMIYKAPFPGVTVDTLIFNLRKGMVNKDHKINLSEYGKATIQIPQQVIEESDSRAFEYFEDSRFMDLVSRLGNVKTMKPLAEFCDSTSGYGGKSELISTKKRSDDQILTLKGDSIGRYQTRKTYWFDFNRKNITGRTTDKRKLGAIPKILMRKTGDSIIATYDDSGVFPEQSLYFLYNFKPDFKAHYILGILNSSLLNFYYQAKSLTNKSSIAQVKKVDLDLLPIRTIDFSDAAEKKQHDEIVKLVETLLQGPSLLESAKNPATKAQISARLAAADRRLDDLVFALYGLDEAEIALVNAA